MRVLMDEERGALVLQVLEELQQGTTEFLEATRSLCALLEQVQDEETRWDLERAWWTLEALEERIQEELEEGERVSASPTSVEEKKVDLAVRAMREVLESRGVTRVALWKLYRCRVCGADQGTFLPWGPDGNTPSLLACSCCGSEAGKDDTTRERARRARAEWVESGAKWWDPSDEPSEWDPRAQLGALPESWR